jgi:hypothetical protein
MLREMPTIVVINPGFLRTFTQIAETVLLMGYFVGRRRWETTIGELDPELGEQVKVEDPPSEPDTGGFDPTDFSL